MTVPVLRKHWECPNNCGSWATTVDSKLPHHQCKRMHGLLIPLIPAGSKAGVKLNERQDYVGGDLVDYTEGKVIMSTTVERDDGMDCTVYAPCATVTIERGSA